MPRKRKITDNGARAALALLERDPIINQEEVAKLFGISRTQLRRALERLVDTYGEQEPDLDNRVQIIREKVLRERPIQGGRAKRALEPIDVKRIQIVREEVPNITMMEVSEIFGVSRAAIYRALKKIGDGKLDATDATNDILKAEKTERVHLAKMYILPASQGLTSLAIPNDLTEKHRDLFVDLIRTVENLERQLSQTKGNSEFVDADHLSREIDKALPLWKQAWETFIIKAAEGAGLTAGKGAVFSAGFIAGLLYKTFSH